MKKLTRQNLNSIVESVLSDKIFDLTDPDVAEKAFKHMQEKNTFYSREEFNRALSNAMNAMDGLNSADGIGVTGHLRVRDYDGGVSFHMIITKNGHTVGEAQYFGGVHLTFSLTTSRKTQTRINDRSSVTARVLPKDAGTFIQGMTFKTDDDRAKHPVVNGTIDWETTTNPPAMVVDTIPNDFIMRYSMR